MEFRVAPAGSVSELSFSGTITALSNASTGLPYVFEKSQPAPLDPAGKFVRPLTLNEGFDEWGRLIQRLGTTVSQGLNNQGLTEYGIPLEAFPTEITDAGKTEVWQIFNLTGDVHPIHFHLVNVQLLSRAKFDNVTPTFSPIPGTETLPDANEMGWKETVRMNPGEVITVITKFDLPAVPFSVPMSTRTGVIGHEYVWHCHILEHEEHDMMRPLIVRGHLNAAPIPTVNEWGKVVLSILTGLSGAHLLKKEKDD
jgi:spore coat protein A